MIPQIITLQNFLSYGSSPQSISFDSYNLICLSGKNGHGKSALLDAITWAVWGQARKTVGTNKPDDGLLRLGARQMVVVFEFDVAGDRYRVRREYSKAQGKPQATLDVGVFDADLDDYRSLTEKTIRKTQAVIESVVGLDYETYVNSAFLRQGHANEFSQKSPKERKKILATILGVNRFDGLQSFTLEKGRECGQQIQILQGLQAQDEQVLATAESLTIERKESELAQQALQKTMAQCEQKVQKSQHALEQYLARKKEHTQRIAELHQEENHITQRRTQWLQETTQWRKTLYKLHRLAGTEHNHAALIALREQEKTFRAAQRAHVTAQQHLIAIEKKRMARRASLEKEQGVVREALVQAVHVAQAAFEAIKTKRTHLHEQQVGSEKSITTINEQLNTLEKEQKKYNQTIINHEPLKKAFDKRRGFYAAYVPRAKWLYSQQEELGKKTELTLHTQSPSCPLCEQMLSSKRKQFIHHKLMAQSSLVRHQYTRLHKVLGQLKKRLVTDNEQVKVYDDAVAQRQTIDGQCEMLRKQCAELTQQKAELLQVATTLQKDFDAAEKACDLAKKAVTEHERAAAHAREHDEQLRILNDEHALLVTAEKTYDEKAHSELEQKIAQLEQQQADRETIREQQAALREQRAALSAQRIRVQEETVLFLRKKEKYASQFDTAQEASLEKEVHDARAQYTQARTEHDRIIAQLSTVVTKLEQVAQCRAAFEKRAKEIKVLEEQKSDYTVLATAWSKNGIQALLIEQAIPEIEQEANELLGRLSQNQAQVFIESQRDLKSGGVRETLDIKISDTMGVRPYEMFSGGEAFRIDFALRIAISKLLARRAGTALQVLIIDEGFGSQDEEGLQRLMQALYTVQEDFEKIIIVSHLSEFKENFPVHFVVQKGATGSHVSVEQRG